MRLVRDIMSSPVISVAPNALIEDALELMLRRGVSGLPVIDLESNLVGMLSEFDALVLAEQMCDEYAPISPVAEYMTPEVRTIDADVPVEEAVLCFRTLGLRRLPVVEDGRVVGMLSRRDLIREIRDARQKQWAGFWNQTEHQFAHLQAEPEAEAGE